MSHLLGDTAKLRMTLGLDLEAQRELDSIDLKDEKALSRLRKKVKIPKGYNLGNVRNFFRTYSNPNVQTEWPTIKPIKNKPSNREVRQQLSGEVGDSFNTMKWPSYVPEEARNVEAFNKWNKDLYKQSSNEIKALPNPTGRLYDTGHSELKGFNTSLGLQPRTQNQTTYRNYIVEEGDTIESIAKKTGVAPKVMQDSAKNSKLDKQLLKNLDPGTTIKLEKIGDALKTIRPDLAEIDAGGSTDQLKQFKAVESYIESFAPPEELSKYMRTSSDDYDVEAKGKIFFDEEFADTGEAARFKIDEQKNRAIHNSELVKANPTPPPIGKAKTPKDVFFNVARSGARVAGQSMNPFANIAGDLVGAAMDTAVYISNPKDAEALADMTLSGGQAIISVGSLLIAALPVPGARPGAYALVKLGDRLDQAGAALDKVEKVWNMTREGRQIAKNYKAGKNTKLEGGKSKPNVVSKQSGQEIAEIKKDFQFDTKLKNLSKLRI